MKSGTNQFHGSAEDRYLPGKLVHRQYFEQLRRCQGLHVPCNPFTYHEMGATAGGPVVLPGLYNGKDKTFFFAGFQRHHEKVTETLSGTVPTPEMYAGDFNFGGRGFPIYDPRPRASWRTALDTRSVSGQRHPAEPHRSGDQELSLAHNPWKAPNDPERSAQRARKQPGGSDQGPVLHHPVRRKDRSPVQLEQGLRPLLARARATGPVLPTNCCGRWWTPST